jgi:hypothetical protein
MSGQQAPLRVLVGGYRRFGEPELRRWWSLRAGLQGCPALRSWAGLVSAAIRDGVLLGSNAGVSLFLASSGGTETRWERLNLNSV